MSHLARMASTALGHMVDAIRPGGWLCVEETDWLTSGLSEPRTPALEALLGCSRRTHGLELEAIPTSDASSEQRSTTRVLPMSVARHGSA